MEICFAAPRDAEELLQIYSHYVKTTALSFEYAPPTTEEFRGRIESIAKCYPYLVARVDGRAVGYAYAASFHSREAFKFCAEVSIYIHPEYRGHGVGRALYERLEEILKRQNVLVLYACIVTCDREDEHLPLGSVVFHSRMGYTRVGIHNDSGYKFGKWYSVIWMEKNLAPKSDFPKDFIPVATLPL